MYYLFDEIKDFAKSKGYDKEFSSLGCLFGFIAFNFSSKLPDPYWTISLLGFLFLVPAFSALNFGVLNSKEYESSQNDGLNKKQIGLLVVGTIFWALSLFGMFMPEV